MVEKWIGPSPEEQKQMLSALGFTNLDEFVDQVIPASLRARPLFRVTGAGS